MKTARFGKANYVRNWCEIIKESQSKELVMAMYWGNGRNDVDFEERAYMDTYYIEHRGIVMDLKIVLKTFFKIFKKEGAV